MSENFKLIVITSEKNIAGEAGLINDLFNAGLQMLHMRKPTHTIDEIRKLLNVISPAYHSKIVLHNHYELLNDYNLKGAHLPEKIRKEGIAGKIKHIVSTSFHSPEDILTTKLNLEYAFFSPVFESISKQGYKPIRETKILNAFFKNNKDRIRFPIIALGGITDKNILQTRDIGFSGAACIGYIWENTSPVAQFKKLQKIVQG